MKKIDSKSTRRRSLLRNIRGGAEFTQTIILTVALALAGLAAVKGLSSAIGTKMQTTGQDIQNIK